MKKKKLIIASIVFLIIVSLGVYAYASSVSISGKSDNGMWKYTYKKEFDVSAPDEWRGRIKQLDKQEVEVEKLEFNDNGKVFSVKDVFDEGKAEDGAVTALHPFSADFHLGDALEKGLKYQVDVTYIKDGETHTDTIKFK